MSMVLSVVNSQSNSVKIKLLHLNVANITEFIENKELATQGMFVCVIVVNCVTIGNQSKLLFKFYHFITNHNLLITQGQLLLKLGRLPLASYCIRQAAEMGEGLGQSATQQAIVQSFLANFDKVCRLQYMYIQHFDVPCNIIFVQLEVNLCCFHII